VHHAVGFDESEIVGQPPIRVERHGADARTSGMHVLGTQLGQELLEGANESRFNERTVVFLGTGGPILEDEFPKTGIGGHLNGIGEIERGLGIAFTGEGENGIGSGFDSAIDVQREMDAEEGEARIGNWIDEPTTEVTFLGHDLVVFAAERYDLQIELGSGHVTDAIALESGAVDDVTRMEFLVAAAEDGDAVGAFESVDSCAEANFATSCDDKFGVFFRNETVIRDSCAGNMDGANARGVGLDLAQSGSIEHAQSWNAVGDTAPIEFFEAGEFGFFGGDDDLAADLVRNRVLTAESDHGLCARYGEASLHGAGLVIEAGVDDAAVMAGLMCGHRGFLIEYQNPVGRETASEFQSGGEPDYTGSDDDNIILVTHGAPLVAVIVTGAGPKGA